MWFNRARVSWNEAQVHARDELVLRGATLFEGTTVLELRTAGTVNGHAVGDTSAEATDTRLVSECGQLRRGEHPLAPACLAPLW
jgi:hypothetical protein